VHNNVSTLEGKANKIRPLSRLFHEQFMHGTAMASKHQTCQDIKTLNLPSPWGGGDNMCQLAFFFYQNFVYRLYPKVKDSSMTFLKKDTIAKN